MRYIISFLLGAAAFVGVFIGVNSLINLVTSGFENQDLKTVAKIVLWIFGFGFTLFIGFLVGYLVGGITEALLPRFGGKRKWRRK